jgi:hypothetical protein
MRKSKSDPHTQGNDASPPEQALVVLRKVAASGHISYAGQTYFVSKLLAGQHIQLRVYPHRLVITSYIPLHKEFSKKC